MKDTIYNELTVTVLQGLVDGKTVAESNKEAAIARALLDIGRSLKLILLTQNTPR